MGDVLRTLAAVEQRPNTEVLHDLMTTSSDLIRVRAPSRDAASGSLLIEEAVAFVERSRDMMLAAACAAISKRSYFANREPVRATDYLTKVRMGQTERGCYVLTILSPVAPTVISEAGRRAGGRAGQLMPDGAPEGAAPVGSGPAGFGMRGAIPHSTTRAASGGGDRRGQDRA